MRLKVAKNSTPVVPPRRPKVFIVMRNFLSSKVKQRRVLMLLIEEQ